MDWYEWALDCEEQRRADNEPEPSWNDLLDGIETALRNTEIAIDRLTTALFEEF
jgi:hypothetical protein